MKETTHFNGGPTKKRSYHSFSNSKVFSVGSQNFRKPKFLPNSKSLAMIPVSTFSNLGKNVPISSANFGDFPMSKMVQSKFPVGLSITKPNFKPNFNQMLSRIVVQAQFGNGNDEVQALGKNKGSSNNLGGKESSFETQQPVENPIFGVDKTNETERVIVVTSGKGGVGKTTTTANLGMSIARLGYRVALIDADIGLRNLDLLLGLENRVLYTAMDIVEGQCRLDQALIRDKRWKNLALLAISKNRQKYNVTRKNMQNLIDSVKQLGFHFILIDCPAGIDVGFINAIAPAQEAVIVTTPEITAIRDADRVAGLLEANGIYNVKLIVNRVRPDMIQKNDMMSVRDVQEMLGIPLLGAIPEDTNVIISTNRGEPLVLNKKLTLSGIAFENAARRLIGKQDYFIDVTSPQKGMFQKLQEFFLGEE